MTISRRRFSTVIGCALVTGLGIYRLVPNGTQASGRTWYVSADDGDDDNDGAQDNPFSSINRALEGIQAGDRVEISTGSYREKVEITGSGTADQPIVLSAAEDATVTLDKGSFIVSADYVEIANITIDDNDDDDAAGVFVTGGSGIVLRNLTATHNDGGGIRIKPIDGPVLNLQILGGNFSENNRAGIAAVGSDALVDLVIQNVTTNDNAADGIQIERASQVTIDGANVARNGRDDERNGVFLKNVRGATVRNVATEENGHNGIALRHSEEITISRCISTGNLHHGFDSIEGCAQIAYYNNVSWKNGDATEDKGLYVTDTAGVAIVNNIFAENVGDQIAYSSEGGAVTDIVSDFNVIWRSSGDRLVRYFNEYHPNLADYQQSTGLDGHSISADPAFAKPDDDQFSLRSGSPALDAGTEVAGITEGFKGGAPDIGAIEQGG